MENIFVEFLPPWVETGLQPAFYDKESGTVLQQTARMYARVNMLIRMFNKLSKNTKETVEEYINKFNELKEYVDDYFDNLDVQEEINNKLDVMATDGTLQDILLNYSTTQRVYDTTREMISDKDNLVDGEHIKTLGYYNINDGGGADYIIVKTQPSTYSITLDTNLFAKIITTDINVDQLGANAGNKTLADYYDSLTDAQKVYPNATALTEKVGGVAIQCAINYYHDYTIYLNANMYYKNTQLTNGTYNRINLIGSTRWQTTIKDTDVSVSTTSMLRLNNSSSRCVIKNIEFIGPYEPTDTAQATLESYNTDGIALAGSTYNQIINCQFRQCKRGIVMNNAWTTTFEDCYFVRCDAGIDGSEGSNNNQLEINHCQLEYNNYGVKLGEGRSQLVLNSDIENNNLSGVYKTNEGDIQIISSYFEDVVKIEYGGTYVRNALISGCSFFQNSAGAGGYKPFITYAGAENVTQITVQNCNFIDLNAGGTPGTRYAVVAKNNQKVIKPVLINNTITNMAEYNPEYYVGIHIKNGDIKQYAFGNYNVNYINGVNDGSTTLNINGKRYYRLNNYDFTTTYSIVVPTITDTYANYEFKFTLPAYNGNSTGVFNLVPDNGSTCAVTGHTAISSSDKSKLITLTYIGQVNNKSYWQAEITA